MEISIFIKGKFRGNPRGTGEAAAIVEYIDRKGESHIRQQQIRIENETKNALALKICNAAMRLLLKPCEITLYTDCDYLINAHQQGWVKKWQQDGWKRANGKPPANVEEWKQFLMLTEIHKIEFAAYDDRHDVALEKVLGGEHEKDSNHKK